VQAAINAANSFAAFRLGPIRPVLQQGEPRRRADYDAGADVGFFATGQIEDAADTNLAQKISQVTGRWVGFHRGWIIKPSVRIQANPAQLAANNLSLEDIRTAIAAANAGPGQGNI